MTQFDLRRGAMVGFVGSVVSAAASYGWSSDQPRAAIEVLTIGLLGTFLAVLILREIQAPVPSTAGAEGAYGGFWVRAVALVLDYIPIYLAGVLLAFVGLGAIIVPVLVGLSFAYFVLLWTTSGRTLGMWALGLRVVRKDGGDVTPTVAIRRFLGLFLAIVCVFADVVWVAFAARKRGWADLFSGTVVVRTPTH
jgi:uncharacterized RDD family membrane protein YckC